MMKIIYAGGIHDDTDALNAWGRGEPVALAVTPDTKYIEINSERLIGGTYYVTSMVDARGKDVENVSFRYQPYKTFEMAEISPKLAENCNLVEAGVAKWIATTLRRVAFRTANQK